MRDDLNPAAAVTETPTGEGTGSTPESTPTRETSTPTILTDWKQQAKNLSRDDLMTLLDEHPEGASVKERLGQSHADKVLLKDRERIAQEVKFQAEKDAQAAAWQNKWQNMSRAERAEFLLQNQEMQEQHGRTIASWWDGQSKTVKDAIPELKGKSIEEWSAVFEQHPNSWGETMAALIEEVVKERLAKELESQVPTKARVMAEALLKDKVAKTVAKGEGPDLKGVGPGGSQSDKGFVSDYATGRSNDHAEGMKWLNSVLKGT